MKPQKQHQTSATKTILLLALLFVISTSTALVLSAYPQHIYIDNSTKIGDAKFTDSGVIIKGNQKPIGTGDVIFLEGRDYIRIMANQKPLFGRLYTEGIRTITPQFHQNILFKQEIGKFSAGSIAQVGAGNVIFNIIPVAKSIYNVNAFSAERSESYNIQFVQGVVYVNFDDVMLELEENGAQIKVSLIGTKTPRILWLKVI